MKTLSLIALLFASVFASAAQSVPLAWTAPAGTGLTYRVYASTNGTTWFVSTNTASTTATVTNLATGTWQLYVTAIDSNKLESLPSNIITTPVPVPVTPTPTSVRLNFTQPVTTLTITVP